MRPDGRQQQRLTIAIGASRRHGHTSPAAEIVAHRAGLAGASVLRRAVEVVTYVGCPPEIP